MCKAQTGEKAELEDWGKQMRGNKAVVMGWMLPALFLLSSVWLGASTARAANIEDFGIAAVSTSRSTSEAGRHPDLQLDLELNSEGGNVAGETEGVVNELPPGLIGNPNNVTDCSYAQFVTVFTNCPVDSQIGIVGIKLSGAANEELRPVYNVRSSNDEAVASIGFLALFYPTVVKIKVRTAGDYGLTATIGHSSGLAPLLAAKMTIWGNPADPIHDELRMTSLEGFALCKTACFAPEGKRPSGLTPLPFLSNPTACGEDQRVGFTVSSYQLPSQIFSAETELPPVTDCESVPFEPNFRFEPSSEEAGAPTGLRTVLHIPQTDAVNLPATSAMRDARVTLPEGMTINSAAAEGLEACSDSQVRFKQEVASDCPEGSKLGTAKFVSPALPEAIDGTIYQRTPEPGNLFRIWLVTDKLGLHLKLPGEISLDKQTGRLTTVFHETPQLPVEDIELNFKGGPQAPLKNPDTCGTYAAKYRLAPWSGNPPAIGKSEFTIDEGCDTSGFKPNLEAGVKDPVAGAFSPLIINLTRPDGDQNLGSFDITLPPGLLAKLKGVPLCSDGAAAAASCPADSQIGSVAVASGVGPEPLWIPQPGKAATAIYLAGPYKAAPNSVVTKVPAQAGPFDLGTVAVRAALDVDPDTARATVRTDSLPQILEGVPILYRTVHAEVTRDKFTIAPTNCRVMQVDSTITSIGGATASPTDRFQVGECAALRFGPKLRLRLQGGTARGAYPALTATLKTGKNEANIRRASVALPHSEFLAQEHINTVCTRVQFAAGNCPQGSIYGYAQATTPLLARPLKGPVYLRSSSNPLPDLVAALRGQFDINLVGRIDSKNGGIRTTFDSVPDAPVTKFVLRMKGGAKSLLVNSTDICVGQHRATAKMNGQNGKVHNFRPALRASCGG